MFDFGAHFRLGAVASFSRIIQWLAATAFLVGEVLRIRRMLTHDRCLPCIGRVAPHTCLVSVQQLFQQLRVVHVGRRRRDRMNLFGPAVHADMRLHAKVPLIAFFRLAHLRIAGLVLVFGRARRIDDGGINDSAAGDAQSTFTKVVSHGLKQGFAQRMPFQQMPEAENRALIGHRLTAQVDADETAHRASVDGAEINLTVAEWKILSYLAGYIFHCHHYS